MTDADEPEFEGFTLHTVCTLLYFPDPDGPFAMPIQWTGLEVIYPPLTEEASGEF